jgi:hypothetical protein
MFKKRTGTSLGTIDRVEGDQMVVELDSREMVDIPKKWLASEAKDGLSLIIDFDSRTCSVDAEKTSQAKQEIDELMDKLFE